MNNRSVRNCMHQTQTGPTEQALYNVCPLPAAVAVSDHGVYRLKMVIRLLLMLYIEVGRWLQQKLLPAPPPPTCTPENRNPWAFLSHKQPANTASQTSALLSCTACRRNRRTLTCNACKIHRSCLRHVIDPWQHAAFVGNLGFYASTCVLTAEPSW